MPRQSKASLSSPATSDVVSLDSVGDFGPVAIYGRQSDPNKQAEDGFDMTLSLATQRDEGCKLAQRFGATSAYWYGEQITSEVWEDRPKLSALIGDINKRHIKAIIVYKYNRIARDPNQLTVFVQLMRSKGVRVLSVMEPEPPPNPMGDLIHYITGTFSKIEKQNIIENTMKTKRKLLDSGKLIGGGKPLFGYRYDRKSRTRVVHQGEAKVVRRLYAMVLDGQSLRQIADTLNSEDVHAPMRSWDPDKYAGAKWSPNTLSMILRDPSYYGEPFHAGKTSVTDRRYPSGKRQEKRNPRESQRPIGEPTPAIVSRDTWDRAQVSLQDRRKRPRAKLKLWLRGHVYCPECGAAMTSSTERNGRNVYRCNRSAHHKTRGGGKCSTGSVPVAEVERIVWDRVLTARTQPETLRQKVVAVLAQHERPDYEAQLTLRQQRISKLSSKIDRLTSDLGDAEKPLVRQSIRNNINKCVEEIEREQELCGEIERSLERVREKARLLREVEDRLLSQDGIKDDVSFDEKSRVLDALAIRVECSRRDGDIVITVLMFSESRHDFRGRPAKGAPITGVPGYRAVGGHVAEDPHIVWGNPEDLSELSNGQPMTVPLSNGKLNPWTEGLSIAL